MLDIECNNDNSNKWQLFKRITNVVRLIKASFHKTFVKLHNLIGKILRNKN